MDSKKKLNWFIIFSILILFTVVTAKNLVRNETLVAYAKVVADEKFGINSEERVVIFNPGISSSSFIKKITRLYEDSMLCVVNQAQYDYLNSSYVTDIDSINVNDSMVEFAKIYDGKNVNSNDIKSYISSTSSDGDKCKIVKSKKWFYMIFSAHMS